MILNKDGQEVVSNAKILLTQDVDVGGYLYLGTLDDLPYDASDPESIRGTKKIIQFSKVSMPKSLTEFVRTAWI